MRGLLRRAHTDYTHTTEEKDMMCIEKEAGEEEITYSYRCDSCGSTWDGMAQCPCTSIDQEEQGAGDEGAAAHTAPAEGAPPHPTGSWIMLQGTTYMQVMRLAMCIRKESGFVIVETEAGWRLQVKMAPQEHPLRKGPQL